MEHEDPPNDGLAAALGELLHRLDPLPPTAIELAKLSFGLRNVDAELAALVADSDVDHAAVAVREDRTGDAPRLLTFEVAAGTETDGPVAVEIEVSGSNGRRRLFGQLHPPGPGDVEVHHPTGTATRRVAADDHGCFLIEEVVPGPVSLTWHRPGHRPVRTAWTILD